MWFGVSTIYKSDMSLNAQKKVFGNGIADGRAFFDYNKYH